LTSTSRKSFKKSAPRSITSRQKAPATEKLIVRKWNRPQTVFLKATARNVDFEGAFRAGKTTPLIWKIINYAIEYPGIKMMLSRWTGDSLDMQLKPKFYEECPPELLGKWNAKEEYQAFTNGALVYMRSLKSSDDSVRYSKFAGLTLAVIGIDQAEEVPYDIYHALKGRLSQPGFPQQICVTPNPPAPNHWLVDEFPEDNKIEGHLYINTAVYDNRAILGDNYITELERDYPKGHVLRRRFIEGRRGISIEGQAVYGKVFSRDLHVREVEYFSDYPLIESWDFGQKHPAVTWHQFLPWGWWNVLGEWLGTRQFIDEAVPAVAALRAELFPGLVTLRVCCDPAGAQGQGARHTSVAVLNEHLRALYGPDCGAVYDNAANRPERRQWCIQQISTYMNRLIQARPALLLHPRCEVTIDGLEAGYVYDDRAFTNARLPNFRRPKKDGFYDHLQNTLEYAMLSYGARPVTATDLGDLGARERLRVIQQDSDESDTWYTNSKPTRNRTGY
jgi:hypothetical protein